MTCNHALTSENVAVNSEGSTSCKACKVAFAWGRRRGLASDDPRVTARADANYRRYTEGDEL
jgi:hypothetical protein